jgi:multiple sugar transport system ATP-binding protein
MATVELRNVLKSYGALQVIHGISLAINDGEFVAFVGPSGCGKSTLLRMIAGLESITGGDIEIGDKVVNSLAPKARDIAMVFQNYALYPHMTVARNMGFSLRLQGASKSEIAEKVNHAASILGLSHLLDRYPRHLSGGQRQRVAMGRAIVRAPRVFLFDEPLSNLDAKLRVQMRSEIKSLHQRLKTTTVYVTHDQVEAMTLADKIVVLNGGRVEQAGPPLELYDKPKTLFVAGFIGSPSMNFIEGTTVRAGDRSVLETEDGTMLPLPPTTSVEIGRRVTFGFRPEHILIDPQGIEARVLVVEPTGSETQLSATIGKNPITAVFRDRVDFQPDEMIRLMPDLKRAHIFDQATGERLG